MHLHTIFNFKKVKLAILIVLVVQKNVSRVEPVSLPVDVKFRNLEHFLTQMHMVKF